MLRFLAGTLLLALLIPNPSHAASGPLVTGKCWCAIGWRAHIIDCGKRVCSHEFCTKACQATLPKKESRAEITDISSARRLHYATRHDVDGYAPRHHYAHRRYAVHRAYVRHVRNPIARVAVAGAALGASLAGLPAELAAKVTEIAGACPGMHAISTFRPGAVVAGTHHASLHASHRAADIAGGDFNCAYSHLQGWPGGYSIDRLAGGPVKDHIHVSYAPGSGEWGARFCHLGACGGHSHHYVVRHRGRHRWARA